MVSYSGPHCGVPTVGSVPHLYGVNSIESSPAACHLVEKSGIGIPDRQPKLPGTLSPIHLTFEVGFSHPIPELLARRMLLHREGPSVLQNIQLLDHA